MKNFIIVTLFLVIYSGAKSSPFYDLVKTITTDIANHNVYESATVGFAAVPSTQHMRLNQLLMIANDNQLIALTKHNNAVVRLYALRAIVTRKLPVADELRDQFFMDNTLVSTLQGCIGNKLTVGLISKTILTEKNT